MARPLRIQYPGAVYHVMSQGNAREPIFFLSGDQTLFLKTLALSIKRFNLILHGYCLMDNHYHLLLETPDGNLSEGMRQINGLYTQSFNRAHNRVGHIFRGRYKAILIEKENYLLALCRYIVLNPVRAGVVRNPADYEWSNYRDTAGMNTKPPGFLFVDWILGQFGHERKSAQRGYRAFVSAFDGKNPLAEVKEQSVLGSDAFVSRFVDRLWEKEEIKEIPRRQRYAGRPPLDSLFEQEDWLRGPKRDNLVAEAVLDYGYSLKEVADFLRLHYTTISKIVNKGEGGLLQE